MNEFLWVEKYRPQIIADVILPSHIKATFEDIVNGGEIHNMLLTGTAGLGNNCSKGIKQRIKFRLSSY